MMKTGPTSAPTRDKEREHEASTIFAESSPPPAVRACPAPTSGDQGPIFPGYALRRPTIRQLPHRYNYYGCDDALHTPALYEAFPLIRDRGQRGVIRSAKKKRWAVFCTVVHIFASIYTCSTTCCQKKRINCGGAQPSRE